MLELMRTTAPAMEAPIMIQRFRRTKIKLSIPREVADARICASRHDARVPRGRAPGVALIRRFCVLRFTNELGGVPGGPAELSMQRTRAGT